MTKEDFVLQQLNELLKIGKELKEAFQILDKKLETDFVKKAPIYSIDGEKEGL